MAAVAVRENRVLVTENVKDFAGEKELVIVCVLKSRLRQPGMAEHLARTINAWAQAHPGPYLGLHWPAVSPPAHCKAGSEICKCASNCQPNRANDTITRNATATACQAWRLRCRGASLPVSAKKSGMVPGGP